MIQMVEKRLKRICSKKTAFALLMGYFWLLLVFQTISLEVEMTVLFFLFCGVVSCFITFLLLKPFPEKIAKIEMNAVYQHSNLCGVIIAFITIFIFTICLYGQYPGGMSLDTVTQYSQALGEIPYNDWHPVLHTLIFFTLPLKSGHQLAFIVFMQLVYFSLAFGYLGYVLCENKCPKLFLAVICMFVWINPFMETYMMYPWKDIGMTIFATVLMAYYIQIIGSNGEWLQKKKNFILFVIVSTLCVYMRHNAILFVAPLILIVLFYSLKVMKFRLMVTLAIMFCCISVKILYIGLGVEAPGKRTVELVGLPATVWCTVMQKNSVALPDKTRDVMYSLASPDAYKYIYKEGNFNSIKWDEEFGVDGVNEMSYGNIFEYTWHCFRYAPSESMEGIAMLTDIVWAVDGEELPIQVEVCENSWGISEKPYPGVQTLCRQIRKVFSSGVGRVLFGSIGFEILAMIVLAAMMLSKGRTSFIHIIPLLCYDFGTMLLLSGPDYRFFLFNLPLWLPVVFTMFADKKVIRSEDNSDETINE